MTSEIPANAKKIRCPHCGEISIYHESNISRPFCSERCKLNDLGAWANDEYAIAGSPLEMSLKDDGAIVVPPRSGADNKWQ
ncbi:MAG: DNA gyrase inhibitor YacG [Pseudomonadota bacterium]